MIQNSKNKKLSVMLMSYFSEQRLESACSTIKLALEKENIPFEVIIIDDGSKDNSFQIAQRLEREDERVRAYRLSKNYTTPYAQFAGMSLATGGCVVPVPDDLQRPMATVIEMYRKWEEGEKIVVAYRTSRADGKVNDFFSNLYYKLMTSFSDVDFPKGGTDGFLADREVIDIINEKVRPKNTSATAEVLRLGFDPYFLPYDRPSVKSKSRWTLRKKIRLAMDTFFASSSFPIKLITMIGFITFIGCLLLTILLFYVKFFTENRLFGLNIPGWTTIIVFITMFSGLNLFCLGIVAEYIWRIYEEVKDRPGYIIRKKEND